MSQLAARAFVPFSAAEFESASNCLELREQQARSARYDLELAHFNIESPPNNHVIVKFNIEFRRSYFESARNNHVIAESNIEFARFNIEFG